MKASFVYRSFRFIPLCLVLACTLGCLPDSFLITPVQAPQDLTEQTLSKDALFNAGKIVVIDVDGILLNASKRSLLTAGEHPVANLLEQLDKARTDRWVKAVVLRINSPGGSVTASELMHHEIIRFKESGKPVVAMMMDVAASGGYYIACAADEIVACRSTVTGSIGVIMQLLEVTGTMSKIGVTAETITSGSQKGSSSIFTRLTPEQREVFQTIVDKLYAQFVDAVADGRPKLSRQQVVELADGRVYLAEQALEHGLIDRIGTMNDAIAIAKERAGISTVKVIAYSRPYVHTPNYYAMEGSQQSKGDLNLLKLNLANQAHSAWPPFMYLWSE